MERLRISDLTRGLFSAMPSKKVCRSLFGEVDHETMQTDLRSELSRDLEERSKIWNFDFENFVPKGKENGLDWEAVPSSLGETGFHPSRSLVTSFAERRCVEVPPTPHERKKGSFGRISSDLSTLSPVSTYMSESTPSSTTWSPTMAKLSPSKHTPFVAVPSSQGTPAAAASVHESGNVSQARHILEDADDSSVIKIVNISPKRPGPDQRGAPITKNRVLRMSPRKSNSTASEESFKSSTAGKRKREIQSNTIHDYMKQKKPRRVSLECAPGKMAKMTTNSISTDETASVIEM